MHHTDFHTSYSGIPQYYYLITDLGQVLHFLGVLYWFLINNPHIAIKHDKIPAHS